MKDDSTAPLIDRQYTDHKRKMKSECKHIEALLQTERKAGRDPTDLYIYIYLYIYSTIFYNIRENNFNIREKG